MIVELLKDEDIEQANAFHNRAYGSTRSLTQWQWQFSSRLGSTRPFIVVKDGGSIVGTQALMPINLLTASGPILTAKSEETLVDPSMRGKGVFQAMYAPLLELAKEHGVQAIWGFTPAHKPFEGIGFSVPARTTQLVRPFSPRAADIFGAATGLHGWKRVGVRVGVAVASTYSSVIGALPRRHSNTIDVQVLDEPPSSAGALCRQFIDSWGGVTIYRDEGYLRWRYFDNPAVRATLLGAFRGPELVGWLAYSMDASSIGYIVDAVVPRDPSTRPILSMLVRESVRRLRAAGAIAIRSWNVNRHPFDNAIREVARSTGFFHVRLGEPVVIRLEESLTVHPTLRNWNAWYVTRAFTQGESG